MRRRILLSVLRKEPPRARSSAELFIRYPSDNVCGRAFKALLYFCINIFMPNTTLETRVLSREVHLFFRPRDFARKNTRQRSMRTNGYK